jgi:hypothetical protein
MTAAALLALLVVIGSEAGARLTDDDRWTPEQTVDLLNAALRFVEAGVDELRRAAARPDSETRGV